MQWNGPAPGMVVPGDIGATMLNIANKPWLMDATILVDILTALASSFWGRSFCKTERTK